LITANFTSLFTRSDAKVLEAWKDKTLDSLETIQAELEDIFNSCPVGPYAKWALNNDKKFQLYLQPIGRPKILLRAFIPQKNFLLLKGDVVYDLLIETASTVLPM